MFHFTPPRPHTDFTSTYCPQPLSPRDKYLAAITQAKAAEAEYLAAEAVQQEEAALRRRLQEIQLQKQQRESSLSPHSYPSTASFNFDPYYQDRSYPQGHDVLGLRRQIEEEEIHRRVVEERERARLRAEEEVRLRLQAEQEERLRASAAARKAELERKARIQRQAEAERFILALNRQAEEEQAAIVQRQRLAHPQFGPQNACHGRRQCRRPDQAAEAALHPFLNAVLGQGAAPAQTQQKSAPAVFDINQLLGGPSKASEAKRQVAAHEPTNIEDLFKALFGVDQGQTSVPKPAGPPKSQAPAPQPTSIEDVFKHLFAANQPEHRGQTTTPKPAPTSSHPEADALQQVLNRFLGGGEEAAAAPKSQQAPQASSSSSKLDRRPAEASRPGVEDFSQIFNAIFGQGAPQAQQQQPAPPKAPAAPVASKPEPASVESSLKTQLEARLGNEYASEVRDTIQALLASLQDVPTEAPSAPSASFPSPATSSSKGKAKAAEPTTAPTPSTANATSADVSKSLDEVRSIEATFHLLESEFVFPVQLDFQTPSSSKAPTPASSDTESTPSFITHLSYTSRNNPVRHYEQSLGALMSQLDAVESFGNEALRAMRKEVVGRVERALGELESEVEGRWRARVAKEMKSRESVTAEAEAAASSPAPEPTPAEVKDTAPEVATPEATPATEATEAAQEIVVEEDPQPAVEVEVTTSPSPADVTPEEASSLAESIIAQDLQSYEETSPSETTSTRDISSTPASLDTSVATLKPYDVSPVDTVEVEVDTFLLPASATPDVKAKPAVRDSDVGSDWSEVEA